MYNLSLFFSFSSRMFEPTFSLFRHFVYLDLSRNLVPRSSHSLRLSRHFEYISILVGNFGHVILLCARVFSRATAILKSEKTLGTRLLFPYCSNAWFPKYCGKRALHSLEKSWEVTQHRVPSCGRHLGKLDDVTIYPVLVVARTAIYYVSLCCARWF